MFLSFLFLVHFSLYIQPIYTCAVTEANKICTLYSRFIALLVDSYLVGEFAHTERELCLRESILSARHFNVINKTKKNTLCCVRVGRSKGKRIHLWFHSCFSQHFKLEKAQYQLQISRCTKKQKKNDD